MLSFHGFLTGSPRKLPPQPPTEGAGRPLTPPVTKRRRAREEARTSRDLQGLGEVSGNPQRMAPHLLVGNDRENNGKMIGK